MSAITKIYFTSGRGNAPAESVVLILILAGVLCLYIHVSNYKPDTGTLTGPVLFVGSYCKVNKRSWGPANQQLAAALNKLVTIKYTLVLV